MPLEKHNIERLSPENLPLLNSVSIFILPIVREDTVIDLDGPGPLPPFSVTCYKSSTGFITAVRSERTNIKSVAVAMNVMMSVVTIIVTKA